MQAEMPVVKLTTIRGDPVYINMRAVSSILYLESDHCMILSVQPVTEPSRFQCESEAVFKQLVKTWIDFKWRNSENQPVKKF